MTKKTYLCTRPRLASDLIRKGMKAETVTNPWNPDKTAWIFPATPELCSTVAAFYQSIGKPIPAAVRTERA